jgi:hypothetical protein
MNQHPPECTMQDGWHVDGKQFFQCIPIPQLTIHMHSSHYQCWAHTRLKNWYIEWWCCWYNQIGMTWRNTNLVPILAW